MSHAAQRSVWSHIGEVASLFATPLRPSHYVELVNPLWTTHNLQALVEKVWDETKDSRTLTLRPGRGWRAHRAGQHVRVGAVIEGERHTRTYSVSSSPDTDDGCVTITVKAIEGGRVSRHLIRNVKVGDYLPIGLPQGDFTLPEAMPVRPLFITAGSGITPVMSMLRTYVARGNMPDVEHIHYAPHEYDVIFGQELRQMAAEREQYHLHSVFTRALGAEKSHESHFSAAQLDELCPDWREREVWACGPQELVDAVQEHYSAAGLLRSVNVERFHAALAEIPKDAEGGQVRFARSNCEITADGRTPLLRMAESAGLNPPHGCRMGICHSCDTTLVSGRVRDLRTGALIEEPGQKVQVCVCAAAGDVALEL